TFWLQTDRRIHFGTREVENDAQTIKLGSAWLANTSTDDIPQCRLPNSHIRIVIDIRQAFAFRNNVFVIQTKKFHRRQNQVTQRRVCLPLWTAALCFTGTPSRLSHANVNLLSPNFATGRHSDCSFLGVVVIGRLVRTNFTLPWSFLNKEYAFL